jgi:hypothetical protein
VIIAGLIRDDERKTVRKIPLLGDIPAIGYLFSNYDTSDTTTDIIMAITPIVVRSQEIPGPDVARIWSGKEKDFSLAEPYESSAEREQGLLDRPRDEFLPKPERPPSPPEPAGPPVDQPPVGPPPPARKGPPPQSKLDTPGMPPAASSVPQPSKTEKVEKADVQAGVKAVSPPGEPVGGPREGEEGSSQVSPLFQRGARGDSKGPAVNWPPSLPYSIQVNSYLQKAHAEERVRELERMKYDGFTFPTFLPQKGRTYHRVFVGRYKDFRSARESCMALRQAKEFGDDIYVVKRAWAMGG